MKPFLHGPPRSDGVLTVEAPLAPLTTLQVGGAARWLARPETREALAALLAQAADAGVSTFVLGGGSNLLVADAGYDGLVLQLCDAHFAVHDADAGFARVEVGAAMGWDAFVDRCIDANLAGCECLAGIPGQVGATPIQNVGAYGQEVAQTLETVHVMDRRTQALSRVSAAECAFAYRDSAFKGVWRERYVIVQVDFRLRRSAVAPQPPYAELQRMLGPAQAAVPLATLQAAVLQLRRAKSMVYDITDPNHRSAGSFFTNPIVDDALATRLLAEHDPAMPRFAGPPGQTKLSAAWLIERAGFARGFKAGSVGLSTRHALALINRGGARADDILALAQRIRTAVTARFGVVLRAEPTLLGFGAEVEASLKA